jgi:hypothetical protein
MMYLVLSTCVSAYGMAVLRPVPHTPEIDPGMAISGVALLVGTIAVMRVRRKKLSK